MSCGPLKHSVSVGVDMDAENLDSDDSLDVMGDLGETGMQPTVHEVQDLSYASHHVKEDPVSPCYNAQHPDGGCMALTNTYASCGGAVYHSGSSSTSYSSSAPQEQRGQFCASLPCQTLGRS